MIKRTFLGLIVLILTVHSVSAIEFIETNISEYSIFDSSTHTPDGFFPINTMKYYMNKTNDLVDVQLIEFNGTELNSWISVKTKETKGILDIDGDIIYVSSDNKYVFWRNGQTYIKITEKHQKSTAENPVDFIGAAGTGNFERKIISEYLSIYPSDCNEVDCIIVAPTDKGSIYKFDTPPNTYWKVNQHINGWYNCPEEKSVEAIQSEVDKLLLIKDRISDNDVIKFAEQCTNSDFFLIEGIEGDAEIKQCYDYLYTLLQDNGLKAHKRWLYEECYVREYFKERFNPNTVEDYNATYFKDRLNTRDREFTEFIKYKYQYGSLGRVTDEGDDEQAPKNISSKETNESQDVEVATESHERRIAPKSIIGMIIEKIGNFLKWFS